MTYTPENRIERMKELMKPIDQQIMMCDDKQDLVALASIMMVTARLILVQQVGKQAAIHVLQALREEIE